MQRSTISVLLFGLALFGLGGSVRLQAQYGGQGPLGGGGPLGQGPMGQDPNGQGPMGQGPMGQGPMGGGGMGIPMPHIHRKHQDKSSTSTTQAQPTLSADGKTVSNDGKTLLVATKDGRTLTLRLNDQTKFTHSGGAIASTKIIPRTTVHIEAAEDSEAYLTATTVDLVKDAPAETTAFGSRPRPGAVNPDGTTPDAEDADLTRPTILNGPDAPNRPILHHGKPKPNESSASSETDDTQSAAVRPAPRPVAAARTVSNQTVSTDSGPSDFTIGDGSTSAARPMRPKADQLIGRTEDWAQTFTNGLPNYVCEQLTTRYMEASRSAGWEAQDLVGAKVVYEDGHETYKDITVDGRKTSKSMLEIGGATSTGEFASVLRSLLSEGSGAQFKYYRSDSIGETLAAVYDFKVPLQRSDWTITIGGQSLRPAYSGSVWIDKKTAQVRRIEMQADNIPPDFPSDSVQSAVDYDVVPLGTTQFLLPVHAENLSCQRGSPVCSKNAIDFRNYHKYSGESTITFGK